MSAASGLAAADAAKIPRAILAAAAFSLRHRGYEATTLRAIAAAAGIRAASIYHHFPSKEAVVAAVVDEGVRVVHDTVVSALAALPASASPRMRVETAVRAHLMSSLQNSDFTSASIRAFAFLPDAVRKKSSAERRRYEDVWRDLVAEASRAGAIRPGVSLDVVRLMLLGAVNWAGEWYRPGRLSIERISQDFAKALLDR